MKHLAPLFLAVAVLLAACSTAATDETTTTTSSPSGTTATTTTSAAGGGTTTTSGESTTTTADSPANGDVSACVIGVWELDADSFFEQLLAAMPPDEQLGEFSVVDGRYVLTVNADGTFSNDREDWTLGVQSEFGAMEIRINSSQSGTFTLEGDQLSTTVAAGDPPDVEISVDGQPMNLPGGVSPIAPPEADFSGATVSCQGDTLTATVDEFTSTWKRVG
jgi:hypothetical protein